MKTNNGFLSIIILIVVFVVLLLLFRHARDTSTQTSLPAANTQSPLLQDSRSVKQSQSLLPQRQTEGNKFSGLSMLSAMPIEFYGRVIDQDEKPLADVRVLGGTGSKTGFMQDETRNYETKTDKAGLFSFKGFKGDALIIDLKKTGYNFGSNSRRFFYSAIDPLRRRFTPDQKKPVTFQMWRVLGSEPLIYYRESFGRVPSDGTPIHFDLIKRKVVKSGGDLIVSVKWGARAEDSILFDWSATFSVPEGGIMEGGDNVMFQAPADGYQQQLEYKFAAAERKSAIKRTFYTASRNHQVYARIDFYLEINSVEESIISVGGAVWLNPKPGSRNLEYDPKKRVDGP